MLLDGVLNDDIQPCEREESLRLLVQRTGSWEGAWLVAIERREWPMPLGLGGTWYPRNSYLARSPKAQATISRFTLGLALDYEKLFEAILKRMAPVHHE